MVLQSALLVGRLELCLGGIWRHAQDVVELLVFDHVCDCGVDLSEWGGSGVVGFSSFRVYMWFEGTEGCKLSRSLSVRFCGPGSCARSCLVDRRAQRPRRRRVQDRTRLRRAAGGGRADVCTYGLANTVAGVGGGLGQVLLEEGSLCTGEGRGICGVEGEVFGI